LQTGPRRTIGRVAGRVREDCMATPRRTLRDLREEVEDEPPEEAAAPAWFAVTRGAAFFVGGFTLLNLLGEMKFPQYDLGTWWLDLRPLARPAARAVLAATGVLLVIFALYPRMNAFLRRTAAAGTALLAGAALWHTWRYYELAQAGRVHTDLPLPFSLHVAAVSVVVLPGLLTAWWERFEFAKDALFGLSTVALCVTGLAVAQLYCMGKLDERRPADAVIVFGGGSKRGEAEATLAARVKTGCALYREGQARKLLLASLPRDASSKTSDIMSRLAIAEGVPEADILFDREGPQIEAAVAGAALMLKEQKLARVLVAGPFWLLPRIKLCCQRAGLDAHTVPVAEPVAAKDLRASMLREVGALWLCYLDPLIK
jgi:vancomycin permeability regulator SanA